jgi:hypothetical protein
LSSFYLPNSQLNFRFLAAVRDYFGAEQFAADARAFAEPRCSDRRSASLSCSIRLLAALLRA